MKQISPNKNGRKYKTDDPLNDTAQTRGKNKSRSSKGKKRRNRDEE